MLNLQESVNEPETWSGGSWESMIRAFEYYLRHLVCTNSGPFGCGITYCLQLVLHVQQLDYS